ncbi:calmodulin-like protein 7 [Arachis stenosperma]|uniref:calmodulin-like protein 7 n=1 Tax=Arachis stenosperma TaxID=217475 RepID=UPI0025ABE501|nr:calmodulin-like protein 7 [Arachis stenosperma]
MVVATLLLLLLFIAAIINIFFNIPTNKICACLQILFPKKTKTNTTAEASSSPSRSSAASALRKEELRKVFSTFDKNGDGFITGQELKESLRNIRMLMTDTEIDDIVVKFDSNGDGLLDFEEFCLLTRELGGEVEQEEEEVNLKEAFDVFDKDKDGLISVEELALVLTSLGLREGKNIQECRDMIRKVDMDGDGMVNFHEFKKMMINNNGGNRFNPSIFS